MVELAPESKTRLVDLPEAKLNFFVKNVFKNRNYQERTPVLQRKKAGTLNFSNMISHIFCLCSLLWRGDSLRRTGYWAAEVSRLVA